MRCRYCGSSVIHPANEYKDFSVGKAIAGTVVFGPIGAVAGVTGKKISGFRCSQCGEFMERPMDTTTEQMVNDAIYTAKKGNSYSMYGYYKKQYPNIEEVNYKEKTSAKTTEIFHTSTNVSNSSSIEAASMKEKRRYYYGKWDPESPIFIENVIIKSDSTGDFLNLIIWNQSEQIIRSLYLQASVYDDAGDILNTSRCVYQGVNVEPGDIFPTDKAFRLDTDLAYRVDVLCEKVVFTSDEVWRMSDEAAIYQLEETDVIDKNDFPRYRHLLKAYNDISNNRGSSHLHVPLENEEYWRCLCGLPVKNGKSCPRCGCGYEDVQKICAQSFLEKVQHDSVINKAAERAKKTQEEFRQVMEKINSEVYNSAIQYKAEGTIESLSKAAEMFRQISTYKDAERKAEECQNLIISINKAKEEEEKEKAEKEREREAREEARKIAAKEKAKKTRRIVMTVCAITLIGIIAIVALTKIITQSKNYNAAIAFMENGDYDSAIQIFKDLNGYKDSEERIIEAQSKNYNAAIAFMESGDYISAIKIFKNLNGYKDSEDRLVEAKHGLTYDRALSLMESGEYKEAKIVFEGIGEYSDAAQKALICENEIDYQNATLAFADGDYGLASNLFKKLAASDYKDSKEQYSLVEKAGKDFENFKKEYSGEYTSYKRSSNISEEEYHNDSIKVTFSDANGPADITIELNTRVAWKNDTYVAKPISNEKMCHEYSTTFVLKNGNRIEQKIYFNNGEVIIEDSRSLGWTVYYTKK